MIHINPNLIRLNPAWTQRAKALSEELEQIPAGNRAAFIKSKRVDTWGAPVLLAALRAVAGNKCWYSEVPLEGADPNVDHFRPKGDIREVDSQLKALNVTTPGYWWLAFEYRNFRLTSMHSNQRRVDENTEGGKWDFFPVRGARAPQLTEWGVIVEDNLALDPCSASDVALLWFDPNGTPGIAKARESTITAEDRERVNATIWLYHLDKGEIHTKRAAFLDDLRKDLSKADAFYKLWKTPASPSLIAKLGFDQKLAEIRATIADDAPFAGAKRCAVRTAITDYPWIDEFQIV